MLLRPVTRHCEALQAGSAEIDAYECLGDLAGEVQ